MATVQPLEITFIALLVMMVVVAGVFGAFVAVRVVEPRGMRAFLRHLAGK